MTSPDQSTARDPDDVRLTLIERGVLHLESAAMATLRAVRSTDPDEAARFFAQADYWRIRASALDLVTNAGRAPARRRAAPATA